MNEELAPFRILTGIEVDILEDGSLDQDPDLLAQLDVVVASVHSKLKMEPAQMTRAHGGGDREPPHRHPRALHGTDPRRQGTASSRASTPRRCSTPVPRTGTAVEINSRPERLDPPDELLAVAVGAGCVVSIDTDAHAPGQLEWLGNGCEKAADAAASTPIAS